MKEADLESLMGKALEGDRQSYAELLRETTRFLKPYLSLRLREEHEVDDVLQEILLSIHKARHTYDGNRPYKPWAYAIAKFRLQDHFRFHYGDYLRQAVELSEIEESLAEPVTENAFSYESIRGEIERLPEKQAVILTLIHREGCTAREVAERMGMKESAVKVAAHRAYKLLRKKLEE